jgi:hypothetical protein
MAGINKFYQRGHITGDDMAVTAEKRYRIIFGLVFYFNILQFFSNVQKLWHGSDERQFLKARN